MPLRSLDNEKFGSERLTSSPLSGGNYATVFSAGTWLTETALSGWGERTRTRKRHFREAVEILGEFSFNLPNIVGPETFRPRAATKTVEMTSAVRVLSAQPRSRSLGTPSVDLR